MRYLLVVVSIFMLSYCAYALPMPVGITGVVTIDGVPADGIIVNMENLNTGEKKITVTKEIETGEHGWYIGALGANNGDIIRVYVIYNGETFEKTLTVNLSRATHYANITINTGTSQTPPPSPPPSSPLHANFTYSPLNPKVGDEVTFTDISEGDVASRTWTIDGKSFTTKIVTYTFNQSGYYTISLVVMDNFGNIDICQKAIFISPNEQNNETNETNTSQEPQKTNITLFIFVKNKNNQTLPNVKVEIYQNNTIVQIVYTNETGMAQATLPAGSYKIKAYYGTQTETKRMQFSNDGRVVFLFNPEETQPSKEEGFNWLIIAIPIVILIIVVLILIMNRRRKVWWK